MARKRRPQARRARRPRAKTSRSISINIAQPKPTRKGWIATSQLRGRSAGAREHALHVLAAMRRNPSLSLSRAAELEGVKPETVKKNFPLALGKSGGKFRATKTDRYRATLYLPDAHGNSVPLQTRSSRERQQASQYLRDLGRYLRGQKNALAKWHGKKIAGVELVTAGRTIVAIEPALSEFSLYRAFSGGGA
jgi:hypothetical protein